MDVKDILFKELIKNGYAEENGKRVWNMANRSFLHLTEDLSKSFLKLMNFEKYKKHVFDREVELLNARVKEFIQMIGVDQPFNLIDIGCADGTKAKVFLNALNGRCNVRYCPVSPDDYLVNSALQGVKQAKFDNVVAYEPHKAGFRDLEGIASRLRSSEFRKNVILLHGSILASYEINYYLFGLSRGMLPGDYIIIGNGIRKGERLVNLDAYKMSIFSDWFVHLIRALGLQEDDVEYDAQFGNSRFEGLYRLKVDKTIKHNDKEITFKKGDEILVAVLYKYYLEELEKFFGMYFSTVAIAKDDEDEFILALCGKQL